jgi:hypothetical protein
MVTLTNHVALFGPCDHGGYHWIKTNSPHSSSDSRYQSYSDEHRMRIALAENFRLSRIFATRTLNSGRYAMYLEKNPKIFMFFLETTNPLLCTCLPSKPTFVCPRITCRISPSKLLHRERHLTNFNMWPVLVVDGRNKKTAKVLLTT